jgi:hypothetical protein
MTFNIFEYVAFLFNFVLAYFLGRHFSNEWGILGWVVGMPLGFGIGILILKAVSGVLDYSWYRWRPLRPPCRKGSCMAQDYKLVEVSTGGLTYQCKCGDKYRKLAAPERFVEVLSDGSLRPYMKRRGIGRWEHDSGDNSG